MKNIKSLAVHSAINAGHEYLKSLDETSRNPDIIELIAIMLDEFNSIKELNIVLQKYGQDV